MDIDKFKEAASNFIAQHKAIDTEIDRLRASIGVSPEAPLWTAIANHEIALVSLIESQAGPAASGWLDWYVWENDCGEKGMEAGLNNQLRPIRTIDDLCWVISLIVDAPD